MGKDGLSVAISSLASRVRAVACSADNKWCSEIVLTSGFCDEKNTEYGLFSLMIKRVLLDGELVHIDTHLIKDDLERFSICDQVSREIEPFIIGVGEVKAAVNDNSGSLVICRGERDVEISIPMAAAGVAVLDEYEDTPIFDERLVARIFSAMVRAHGNLGINTVELKSYID
jgi:hypothetical protein